jgi:hypothetical protein
MLNTIQCRRVWSWAIAIVWALAGLSAHAAEPVELRIPLREGRYYRARDFYAQCNEKLGAHYS